MLTDFLKQTCNITQKVITMINGEQVPNETPVYTNITCYYYWTKKGLSETDEALNTDLSEYKVILEPNRTLVRENMIIEIIDPDFWNIWKFKIYTKPKMNRLINWDNHSIEFAITKFN